MLGYQNNFHPLPYTIIEGVTGQHRLGREHVHLKRSIAKGVKLQSPSHQIAWSD